MINSLWAVFAAAGFAAAGFSAVASETSRNVMVAVVVGLAYTAFAFGHWRMLKPELERRSAIAQQLDAYAARHSSGGEFDIPAIVKLAADTAARPHLGLAAHLVLDFCVLLAIAVRGVFDIQALPIR